MPDEALRGLFGSSAYSASSWRATDASTRRRCRASPVRERFSAPTAAVMSLAFKLPVAQFYWNGQLKKNGAWDARFDAPYARG